MRNKVVWVVLVGLGLSVWVAHAQKGVLPGFKGEPSGPPIGCRFGMDAGPGGGMWMMRLCHDRGLAQKVGLSEEEQAKIRNLVFEHRKKQVELRAQIEKRWVELHQAAQEPKPDLTKVDRLIDEVHQLMAQAQKERFRLRQAVAEILGEQRFSTLMRESRSGQPQRELEGRRAWWQRAAKGGAREPGKRMGPPRKRPFAGEDPNEE